MAVTSTDSKGLMPIHYAMGNCDRYGSPSIVELLLSKEPNIVRTDFDHQHHPLFVLADRATKLKEDDPHSEESRKNALKAMSLFLDAEPAPTTNFFASLHSIPKWMLDKAVVHPNLQELLNDKISKRFPTAIMMADFYALVTILSVSSILTITSIDRRSNLSMNDAIPSSEVVPLYLCGLYFGIREIIQLMSFIHLGLFRVWYRRTTNWLEIGLILIVSFWAIALNTGSMSLETFRVIAAITIFFFSLNFLNYLRGLLVEFAVFVSGVLHVVQSLGPFLLALLIILIAFMQMFSIIFQQTSYCNGFDTGNEFVDVCDPEGSEPYRFCTRWRSLLSVYTMLLGEVDEADFGTSRVGTLLFIVFVFLVVILLSTILIALISDAYSVIRNERAAIVFWANRLDFIVEMDVIRSGVLNKVKLSRNPTQNDRGNLKDNVSTDMASCLWKTVMDVFDKDLNQMELWSFAFLCLTFLRLAIVFIVIPLWIALGLLCFGALWPHQWRKKLFEQNTMKENVTKKAKAQQNVEDLNEIRTEFNEWQNAMSGKFEEVRSSMHDMKADVEFVKADMEDDLRDIQELMNVLYDLHRSVLKSQAVSLNVETNL